MSAPGLLHRFGIRGRVLLLAVLPVLAVSLVLGYTLVTSRLDDARLAQQQKAQVIARNLALAAEFPTFSKDAQQLNRVVASVAAYEGVRWAAVWDRDRDNILSAGESVPDLTAVLTRVERGRDAFPDVFHHPIGGDLLRIVDFAEEFNLDATVSEVPQPSNIGWALVGMSSQAILQREAAIIRGSLLITLGGLLFSVLLGVVIGNGITRPIRRLMEAVKHLRAERFETRVARSTGGEIGELEAGFDQMARALQEGRATLEARVELATDALRDSVAELERKNRHLEAAQRAALQAGQERTLFLARMSHEIRTPLNAVVGFTRMIAERGDRLPPEDYTRTIQAASRQLQHVIDDILQFIRLDEAANELDCVDFDPADCLEDVVAMLGPMAAEKGLELVLLLHSDLPRSIHGDPGRFSQVIVNLANNAIKFTESGHVVVEAGFELLGDGNGQLSITVADTGPGVAPENLGRIFSAFNQADSSVTRRYGGAGLGLSIAKRLAELMGGGISVTSSVGHGSTFVVTMPCTRCADPRPVEPLPGLAGSSILLYDQNGFTRRALRGVVFSWGAHTFSTGRLEQLEERLESSSYDLVVIGLSPSQCDVGDAARVVDRVRAHHAGPLVLLTGRPDWPGPPQIVGDAQIALSRKPIRRDEFRRLVAKMIAPEIPELPSTPKVTRQHPGLLGLRVLAAEDNEFNRLLLREVLTVQGVVLELAKDGVEATEKALGQPFDVILIDLHMPRLDGWDAATNIREQLGDTTPPIIALTADVFGETHSEATRSPFDAWILKPIDAAQLVAEISNLDRGQATVAPPGSTSAVGAVDAASVKGSGANHPADLRQRYIDEMTSLTQQARSVLTEGDLTVLQRYTHDLLGIAGVMGFPEMAAIAAEANSAAKAHDIERATQLIQTLDAKLSNELQI